jgi:hypothetical protein
MAAKANGLRVAVVDDYEDSAECLVGLIEDLGSHGGIG